MRQEDAVSNWVGVDPETEIRERWVRLPPAATSLALPARVSPSGIASWTPRAFGRGGRAAVHGVETHGRRPAQLEPSLVAQRQTWFGPIGPAQEQPEGRL